MAIRYTKRCSFDQERLSFLTAQSLDVIASGTSNTNALKPIVMKGRLITSLIISEKLKSWSNQNQIEKCSDA